MKLRYMLDTNICIYIIKRVPEQVMQRLERCKIGEVAMSTITYAELQHGVQCSENQAEARAQVQLLTSAIRVVSFDMPAATEYGAIQYASGERRKNLMDKLIAAHAVALKATLVTNNVADFPSLYGLRVENWAVGAATEV